MAFWIRNPPSKNRPKSTRNESGRQIKVRIQLISFLLAPRAEILVPQFSSFWSRHFLRSVVFVSHCRMATCAVLNLGAKVSLMPDLIWQTFSDLHMSSPTRARTWFRELRSCSSSKSCSHQTWNRNGCKTLWLLGHSRAWQAGPHQWQEVRHAHFLVSSLT